MRWVEIGTRDEPGLLSAYEDWEEETRPPSQRRAGGGWHPVYVRLERPHPAAAARLLAFLSEAPDSARASADTSRRLARLAQVPAGKEGDEDARAHLFLYRPDAVAHDALPDVFRPLRVGPAVPVASVGAPAGAAAAVPAAARAPARGRVLTGVIDDAIGVAHERFRDARGRTRVVAYWRQAHEAVPAGRGPVLIGREWTGPEIDAALAALGGDEAALYRRIETAAIGSLDPAVEDLPGRRRTMTQRAGHGTFVADLAAGAPPDDPPSGRPIAAVELPPLATAETWGSRFEVFALEALLWLIDRADACPVAGGGAACLPLVVNLSYGMAAGPKDGTGFLEREIRRHVEARNARGVPTLAVLPAGNDYRARRRAVMRLAEGERRSVEWCVQPADRNAGFLEVRLPEAAAGRLTIADPAGHATVLDLSPGRRPRGRELRAGSVALARLYVQPAGGGTLVTLAVRGTQPFEPGMAVSPAGAWRVTLAAKSAFLATVEAQRDDSPRGFPQIGRPSYLDDPEAPLAFDRMTADYTVPPATSVVTRDGTLSANATARSPGVLIVGGAMGGPVPAPAPYTGSGEGLARGGPDLSAVSEDGWATAGVLAAGTFSGSAVAASGTSAAAPLVTRAAVEFIAAHGRLPAPADLLPITLPTPDARLGQGILPSVPTRGRPARRRA